MKKIYFSLQSKIILKTLPLFALGVLIFSTLAGLAGFGIYKALYADKNTGFFETAVVLPEEDQLINTFFDLASEIAGLQKYMSFRLEDEETAMNLVKSNEVYGAIIIPNGFIEDIVSGINTPARLIISDKAGYESLLLRSIIDALSSTLSSAQAGVYALDDTYSAFGASYDERMSVNESINTLCLKYALNRSGVFEFEKCSTTGTLSHFEFYICSGIVLVLLFSGMTLSKYVCSESDTLLRCLNRKGISNSTIFFSKVLGVTLTTTLLLFIIYFAANGFLSANNVDDIIFSISISNLLRLLFVIFSVSCFITFIFILSGRGAYGILVIFVMVLLMCFASGIIVPAAYLPTGISGLGRLLPTEFMSKITHELYTDEIKAANYVFLLLYDAAFATASIFVMKLRIRK